MTIPDKRATLDATRPSTKLERIVANYHNRVRVPQLDEVMEFHRHWVGFANKGAPLPVREAYEYASQAIIDKDVDAHCHVWEDHQFKSQIEQLIEGGFLQSYRLALFEPYFLGTYEFAVGLASI